MAEVQDEAEVQVPVQNSHLPVPVPLTTVLRKAPVEVVEYLCRLLLQVLLPQFPGVRLQDMDQNLIPEEYLIFHRLHAVLDLQVLRLPVS